MCRYFPVTLPDMKNINGVGDTKLERYGRQFVEEIKAYLEENPDARQKPVPDEQTIFPTASLKRKRKKGETVKKTRELFEKGLSIKQIANERKLALSTIADHFERMILNGEEIDIDRLVEPAKQDMIKKMFLSLNTTKLTPVVEGLGGKINYEEAKIVRAVLEKDK